MVLNGLGIATLRVAAALELALLRRRRGARHRRLGELLGELGAIRPRDVIEWERIEATQSLIGIAMNLEVTGDVSTRETELVGGPGDVLKAAGVL